MRPAEPLNEFGRNHPARMLQIVCRYTRTSYPRQTGSYQPLAFQHFPAEVSGFRN